MFLKFHLIIDGFTLFYEWKEKGGLSPSRSQRSQDELFSLQKRIRYGVYVCVCVCHYI